MAQVLLIVILILAYIGGVLMGILIQDRKIPDKVGTLVVTNDDDGLYFTLHLSGTIDDVLSSDKVILNVESRK